jgi:hypoxanthine phosphoribosyltransferase
MVKKEFYNWQWVDTQIDNIGEKLEGLDTPKFVTGIPRGGLIPAILISHKFNIPYIGLEAAKALPGNMKKQILVIDDIADSGNTLAQIDRHNFITATLATRYNTDYLPTITGTSIHNDNWLVFPWEDFNAKAVQDYLAK